MELVATLRQELAAARAGWRGEIVVAVEFKRQLDEALALLREARQATVAETSQDFRDRP